MFILKNKKQLLFKALTRNFESPREGFLLKREWLFYE